MLIITIQNKPFLSDSIRKKNMDQRGGIKMEHFMREEKKRFFSEQWAIVNYYCVARSTTLYKTFSIVTRANKQLIGKEKGLHNSVTFKRSAHYKLTIYSHAICGQQLTVNVFTLYRIYVTGLHVVTFNTCSIFWSSSGKWGERKREIRDIQQKIMVRMLPSV